MKLGLFFTFVVSYNEKTQLTRLLKTEASYSSSFECNFVSLFHVFMQLSITICKSKRLLHAQNQKHNVDDQQQYVLVVSEIKQEGANDLRDLFLGHNEGKGERSAHN